MTTLAELGEAVWTARDLYPLVLGDVPRGDRAAAHRVAVGLRASGFSIRQIAEATGWSRTYVRDLFYDPTGAKARARKDSYRGRCEECGGPTDGSEGRAKAPKICARCIAIRQHEERQWTRETIAEALRVAARVLGRTPVSQDTIRAPSLRVKLSPERVAECERVDQLRDRGLLILPPYNTVRREFGSWAAACDAAGLPQPPTGGAAHRGRRLRLVVDNEPPATPEPRASAEYQPHRYRDGTVCPRCGDFCYSLDETTGFCRACVRDLVESA